MLNLIIVTALVRLYNTVRFCIFNILLLRYRINGNEEMTIAL